jgi:hypothetical protein
LRAIKKNGLAANNGISKKLRAMKDEEWEILGRKGLRTIQMNLAASVAFNISK